MLSAGGLGAADFHHYLFTQETAECLADLDRVLSARLQACQGSAD